MIFNTAFYWGTPARILHWVAAAMILFLYFHGLVIEEWYEHNRAAETAQLHLHAATGATLAVWMLGRYLWRLANKIPMLPAKSPDWEKKLAGIAHIGLYIATFVTIVAGWMLAGARQPALEVKFLGLVPVPTWAMFQNKEAQELIANVHAISAHLLMLMVLLHVVAALWHHYVHRDSVLKRMLLRGKNRTRA